jgi:bacterioferritin
MDTSTFIERLNEDPGTEYQSIVQYIQHIATIRGPEYRAITEEMANHLGVRAAAGGPNHAVSA